MKKIIISIILLITVFYAIKDSDSFSEAVASHVDNIQVLNMALYMPEYQKPLYRVKTEEKYVALTVDDGPDPRFTPELLDILKEHNAHATFFLVGNQVLKYPKLAKREISEGNEVGNHTLTHPDLLKEKGNKAILNEINGGAKAIESVLKIKPKYFRAPKGLLNKDAYEIANALGERVIVWNVTLEHYATPTPKLMARRIINKATPGSIILMHDGRLNRSRSIHAIPMVIEGLQKKGYKIVTLSELLAVQDEQTGTYHALETMR